VLAKRRRRFGLLPRGRQDVTGLWAQACLSRCPIDVASWLRPRARITLAVLVAPLAVGGFQGSGVTTPGGALHQASAVHRLLTDESTAQTTLKEVWSQVSVGCEPAASLPRECSGRVASSLSSCPDGATKPSSPGALCGSALAIPPGSGSTVILELPAGGHACPSTSFKPSSPSASCAYITDSGGEPATRTPVTTLLTGGNCPVIPGKLPPDPGAVCGASLLEIPPDGSDPVLSLPLGAQPCPMYPGKEPSSSWASCGASEPPAYDQAPPFGMGCPTVPGKMPASAGAACMDDQTSIGTPMLRAW